MNKPLHTFHVPVMGVAYTIDAPIKIARFGINSVISIIGDSLIEKMREYYYKQINEEYIPIPKSESDFRSKRITDYLNLVNKIVKLEFEKIKKSDFTEGSQICAYFEMLPDASPLKKDYLIMLGTTGSDVKEKMKEDLRSKMVNGCINVNVMTKIDKNNLDKKGNIIEDGSDAVGALRGYCKSNLSDSAVVFSAGMNPRLYNYLERWDDFALHNGGFKKKVIIKVSDYRSALIQGKYLAKRGIWVSEFRIESGLNCGGHAFATDGYLLGPILDEFKNKRPELVKELFDLFLEASKNKGREIPSEPSPMLITVQGGIGTYEEDRLLLDHYQMDGTGWGSPFLLVPEVTNVEKNTLELLCKASEEDISLSKNSPLGVPFSYLRGTSSQIEKQQRAAEGKPGSPCTEKNLISNTEFTKVAICTASVSFQKQKLKALDKLNLSVEELNKQRESVLRKECLCVGLSNSALVDHETGPIPGNSMAVSICPGPNIVYFSKVASLKEMVDHIYGRNNLLNPGYRPHFFIKELFLYVDYVRDLVEEEISINEKKMKYYQTFCQNLMNGIQYYHHAFPEAIKTQAQSPDLIKKDLVDAQKQIGEIMGLAMKKALVVGLG